MGWRLPPVAISPQTSQFLLLLDCRRSSLSGNLCLVQGRLTIKEWASPRAFSYAIVGTTNFLQQHLGWTAEAHDRD